MVFSFLSSAFGLAVISNNWNMIMSDNFFWIGINVLLIIIIPIDTILTYFVHARQRDIVNAKAGIMGLLAMTAFYLIEFDSLFIPFGIIIFVGLLQFGISCISVIFGQFLIILTLQSGPV